MAEHFMRLPTGDRPEALAVAAAAGRPIHLLEKDIWVVWSLEILFGTSFAEHLVFKGGTSLSKAYGVIRRFSEDVDITYDIRALSSRRAQGSSVRSGTDPRWPSQTPPPVAGQIPPGKARGLCIG
jgi:Nucleotidyl transferase AbiEii toxin, Type IV TA system